MAKQIRQQDIYEGDIFKDLRDSVRTTKIEYDALLRDLEALLPLSKQILDSNKLEVTSLTQKEKLYARLNAETERAKAIQDQQLRDKKATLQLIKLEEQAEQAQIKTKADKNRLSEQELRITKRQQREQERLTGAYNKVNEGLNSLAKRYRDLAIRKELGEKLSLKEELRLVRLSELVKKYDKTLKDVDAQMGRHNRNVGNYKSAYDSLGNAINQVTREGSSFLYSAQTGFLAISNNLPILFDELGRLKKRNAEIVAQGGQVKSVFKSIAGAIFSMGTALSLGVTLLTLFGGKIINWVSSLFEANKVLTEQEKLLIKQNKLKKEAAERFQKQTEYISKESSTYFGLIAGLKQTNAGSERRVELINEINDTYGTTLQNLKDEKKFQDQLNESVTNYIALKRAEYKIKAFDELIQRGLKKEAELTKELADQRKYLESATKDFVNSQTAKGISVTQRDINIRFNESINTINDYNQEIADLQKRLESYGFNIEQQKQLIKGLGFETKKTAEYQGKLNKEYSDFNEYLKERNKLMGEVQDTKELDYDPLKQAEEIRVTEAELNLLLAQRSGDLERIKQAEEELLQAKLKQLEVEKNIAIITAKSEQEKELIKRKFELESEKLKTKKKEDSVTDEEIKNQKQLIKLTQEALKIASDYIQQVLQAQIDQIDRQIQRVQRQYDLLAQKAVEGNLLANESLKEQLRLEQELLAIQEKKARNQRIIALITQGIQFATGGGQGSGLNLSSLAGFKTGTEGTIGDALSGRHLGTVPSLGYDDTIVRVNKKEGIINEQNMKYVAPYGVSRIIQSGLAYERMKSKMNLQLDMSETNKLLERAINNKIDYKIGEVVQGSFDIIRKEVNGNNTQNTIYRVKFPTKR